MEPEDSMTPEQAAALYMLGLLTAEEAAAFQAALQARRTEQLKSYAKVSEIAAALAASVAPAAPPPGLLGRLMQRVGSNAPQGSVPKLGAVLAGGGKWLETGVPGVTHKRLYFDKESGLATSLVRMQPGARYPAHLHTRTEQCLILEGDLWHPDHAYAAGDFTFAETGSVDPEVYTVAGNLLLVVGAPANESIQL